MQTLDLFSEFAQTPDLPLAHRHVKNHRTFDESAVKIENWTFARLKAAIKIARDRRGYHFSIEYEHQEGGHGGPVFIMKTPLETYQDARRAAIAELKHALSVRYGSRPAALQRSIKTALEKIQ